MEGVSLEFIHDLEQFYIDRVFNTSIQDLGQFYIEREIQVLEYSCNIDRRKQN